jgi:hypothetical protein
MMLKLCLAPIGWTREQFRREGLALLGDVAASQIRFRLDIAEADHFIGDKNNCLSLAAQGRYASCHARLASSRQLAYLQIQRQISERIPRPELLNSIPVGDQISLSDNIEESELSWKRITPLATKSKSTDSRCPKCNARPVPPYRTNSGGTQRNSSQTRRCGGGRISRRG